MVALYRDGAIFGKECRQWGEMVGLPLVAAMSSPTARHMLVFVNLQVGPIWVKEKDLALYIAYTSVVYCFENKKDSHTVKRHESKEVLG